MSKQTARPTATFVYVTFIRSTAEKVFEALTRPEMTRRYWAHDNVSDWKPGSKWAHVNNDDQKTVHVIGKVVENVPPRRLVFTWAAPENEGNPDKYSRVTFELQQQADFVKLTCTHDELEPDSAMLKGVSSGWPLVLSSLKTLLETGQGVDIYKVRAA